MNRFTSRRIPRSVVTMVVVAAVAILGIRAESKVAQYSTLSLAEEANTIIVGTITTVKDYTASIQVEKTLRGNATPDSIKVAPIYVHTCFGSTVIRKKGERVAAFLTKSGGSYLPVGQGQGLRHIPHASRNEDLRALTRLAEITAMKDTYGKYVALMAESSSSSTFLRSALRECVVLRIGYAGNRQAYKDPIVRLLRSSDSEVQNMALQALKRIHAPEAIPLIIKAMQSRDLSVVQSASMALAQYDTRQTVAEIITLTKHPDEAIRCRGAIDLRMSARPEARQAIMRLTDDPNPRVRAIAVGSPVFWLRDGKAKEFIPVLIKKLRDPGPEVGQRAAATLGESRDYSVVGPLLDVLRSGKFSEQLEGGVVQALGMVYGDPEGKCRKAIDANIGLIVEALKRGHRQASRGAISILGVSMSPKAIPALEDAAKNHPIPEMRDWARRAIETHR